MRQRVWVMVIAAIAFAAPAIAQQRPLVTEDPETIGSGNILIEGGFDEWRDVTYPASGLEGNLIRFPTLGVSFGLGSIAELQIDGGLYNHLHVTHRLGGPLASEMNFTGDSTHDVEDIVVATKIRVLSEEAGRPAVGIRFATMPSLLKRKLMPVPDPTHPSATGPPAADSSAASRCSARTCIPSISFRKPS